MQLWIMKSFPPTQSLLHMSIFWGLVCTVGWVSTNVCSCVTTAAIRILDFSIIPDFLHAPFKSNLSLHPPSLVTYNWYVFSLLNFAFLWISYTWNRAICCLFWRVSFACHTAFEICPWCYMYQLLVSLCRWVVWHCVDVQHPFAGWRTFGFFPVLDCYK